MFQFLPTASYQARRFEWDSVEEDYTEIVTHQSPTATPIVQHSYTYDETNNIVEYLNSIDGSTSYDYDFLGQLIGANYANQNLNDESYSYDENGNRITANGEDYTTGTNNELTSDSKWTYTYDDEGNRLSKQNSTNRELYEWDYRNRLTKVTQQEYNSTTEEWQTVQIVEYTYDYNNVWIRKTIDTNADGTADSKTIFIPENYQTVLQIDNCTTAHHYLWTPQHQDKLLADNTTDGILWSLTDHLGTVRDILSTTHTTHLIYDAFGNLTSGTNPILFAYTGKAFDPTTQLQNNINRWYDATIGRWLSVDPIGFHANDANLYRYVGNNPLYHLDALGLETCSYHLFLFEHRWLWDVLRDNQLLTQDKPVHSGNTFPTPLESDWNIPPNTQIDVSTCFEASFLSFLTDDKIIRSREEIMDPRKDNPSFMMRQYKNVATEFKKHLEALQHAIRRHCCETGGCDEFTVHIYLDINAKKYLEKFYNNMENKVQKTIYAKSPKIFLQYTPNQWGDGNKIFREKIDYFVVNFQITCQDVSRFFERIFLLL